MRSDTRLWDDREERIVRFLLGDASASEREAIEGRLFDDRAFLDEMLAVGDDLIDAYLTHCLSEDDRRRFETHFLASPARRERFEVVRGIVRAVNGTPATRTRPAHRWWLPAAAALVVATGGALLLGGRGVREGSVALGTPLPTPPIAATPTALRSAPETLALRLPRRPAKQPVAIAVQDGTRRVRLDVPIGIGRSPSYTATLENARGQILWRGKGFVPARTGDPLPVVVPADVLVADARILRVDGERLRGAPPGGEESWRYPLSVSRAP